MKKLVFKKWYQKRNFALNEKYEEITPADVQDKSTLIVGQTEKAVKCDFYGCTSSKKATRLFFPKSALIVMDEDDMEHWEEMNKVENKEIALKEVNDFLETYVFATKEQVESMIEDSQMYM